MKKFIILLATLFACSEETIKEDKCNCIYMVISDALPIQFWAFSCETYNEKENCGVFPRCWTQQFHCDDEIVLQVGNNEEDQELALNILDVDGELLISLDFAAVVIDQEIPFDDPIQLSNPTFIGSLSPWQSFNGSDRIVGSAGAAWVFNSGYAHATSSSASRTKYLAQQRADNPTEGWPPGDYVVEMRLRNTGESDVDGKVFGMPTSATQTLIASVASGNFPNTGVELTRTLSFTLDQYWPYIAFTFDGSLGFDVSVEVEEISFTEAPTFYLEYERTVFTLGFVPSELSPEICNQRVQFVIVDNNASPAEIAKSDYIEITDNLGCTEVLKYRNQRNFAGIDYENFHTEGSPEEDLYFYLRVPAVFFHEQFREEDEAIELSGSKIITLNSELRAQKLFDTDYMPYYMHRKTKLVLKHQYVENGGKRWTKQNPYEILEGSKKWPVKKATCWLTERDFVVRNVI